MNEGKQKEQVQEISTAFWHIFEIITWLYINVQISLGNIFPRVTFTTVKRFALPFNSSFEHEYLTHKD